MSVRVPFGEHEGRALQEMADAGDWAHLYRMLTYPWLRARHPEFYRALLGVVRQGGQVPAVWGGGRGPPRFVTTECRPDLREFPLYSLCDQAIVRTVEASTGGAHCRYGDLVRDTTARLRRDPHCVGDTRRARVERAILRLANRGVLCVSPYFGKPSPTSRAFRSDDFVARTTLAVRFVERDDDLPATDDLA